MKRICSWLLTLVLVLGLCACGQSAEAKWQEQYDLGMRYLSEGNYEEAIIAFTAAIEIDPRRPDAYLGLADVYEAQGDLESLRAILEQGFQATGDARLEERLNALDASSGSPDTAPQIPEVLSYSVGLSIKMEEYRYVPFHEAAAQAVAPLIAAGAAGNQDETLALLEAEDLWTGLRQAMWENLLANEEISSCLELSPEGPQAQEGDIAFWTQWNGDLICFEYYHDGSRSDYGVEYRPQEGGAFRCHILRSADIDTVIFCYGSTKGWLLNGSVTRWYWNSDGDIQYGEGTAVDELLDGPYQYTAVTSSGGFTNYYQYSNGHMLPCWQGEDGRMYPLKRVHKDDGEIDYAGFMHQEPERVDYGFIRPHIT